MYRFPPDFSICSQWWHFCGRNSVPFRISLIRLIGKKETCIITMFQDRVRPQHFHTESWSWQLKSTSDSQRHNLSLIHFLFRQIFYKNVIIDIYIHKWYFHIKCKPYVLVKSQTSQINSCNFNVDSFIFARDIRVHSK